MTTDLLSEFVMALERIDLVSEFCRYVQQWFLVLSVLWTSLYEPNPRYFSPQHCTSVNIEGNIIDKVTRHITVYHCCKERQYKHIFTSL